MSVPTTMRAWVYRSSGNPATVLKLEENYSVPEPNSKFPILVKVHSVSLNPVGYKAIKELPSFATKKPAVPEQDFAGIVAGGNLAGTGFKLGDEVFGMVPADQGQIKSGIGSLAEYTIVHPSTLVSKPANVSFQDAASVPLAGMTAYTSLIKSGGAKAGSRVLINGGTGGVGAWAVQIAKAQGCHVVATCSDKSFDLAKSLGADELVDYKAGDLNENLKLRYGEHNKRFDVVFDTVGVPSLHTASSDFVTPQGTFVNIAAGADSLAAIAKTGIALTNSLFRPTWLGGCRVPYKIVMLSGSKESDSLAQLKEWLQQGKIKSVIDSQYGMGDAQGAYEKIMSGRAKGKVIVNVK